MPNGADAEDEVKIVVCERKVITSVPTRPLRGKLSTSPKHQRTFPSSPTPSLKVDSWPQFSDSPDSSVDHLTATRRANRPRPLPITDRSLLPDSYVNQLRSPRCDVVLAKSHSRSDFAQINHANDLHVSMKDDQQRTIVEKTKDATTHVSHVSPLMLVASGWMIEPQSVRAESPVDTFLVLPPTPDWTASAVTDDANSKASLSDVSDAETMLSVQQRKAFEQSRKSDITQLLSKPSTETSFNSVVSYATQPKVRTQKSCQLVRSPSVVFDALPRRSQTLDRTTLQQRPSTATGVYQNTSTASIKAVPQARFVTRSGSNSTAEHSNIVVLGGGGGSSGGRDTTKARPAAHTEESRTYRPAYPPSTTKTRAGHDRAVRRSASSDKSVEGTGSNNATIRRWGSLIKRDQSVDSLTPPTSSPSDASSMRTSAGSTPEKRGLFFGGRLRSQHRKTASRQSTFDTAPDSPQWHVNAQSDHRPWPKKSFAAGPGGQKGQQPDADQHSRRSAKASAGASSLLCTQPNSNILVAPSTPPSSRRTQPRMRNSSLSSLLSHFRRDSSRT